MQCFVLNTQIVISRKHRMLPLWYEVVVRGVYPRGGVETNCLRFEPRGNFTTLGGYFLGSCSAPPALLAATRGRKGKEEREVKREKDKKERGRWEKGKMGRENVRRELPPPTNGDGRPMVVVNHIITAMRRQIYQRVI